MSSSSGSSSGNRSGSGSGSSSNSGSDTGSSSESESETPNQQTPATSSAPQKQTLSYPPPKGFSELDVLQHPGIMKEDLSSDDELWVVKMPLGFSPSCLNGADCNYEGNTELHADCEKADFPFVWDVSLKPTTAQGDAFSVLLPSKTTGRLQHAGHFKGEMTIRKQLKQAPKPPIPEAKLKGCALPDGLKQRFVPFGSVVPEPAPAARKKSKKRSAASDTESTPKKVKLETPEVNGITDSSEKKKKKKKDKHKERDIESASGFESASGLETDTTIDTSLSKKKKKKKDKERIKEEQDSKLNITVSDTSLLDVSANSTKKKKKKSKDKDKEEYLNSTMTTTDGEDASDLSLNGSEKKKKKKKKKSKELD